jgi:hypothetical protein
MQKIKRIPLRWIIFFASFLVLFLLLLKNPFSERNLIANLEPYPDTIHYINPALSLISGKGFHIEREGRAYNPAVPPLYTVALIPFYLVHPDARVFFFVNLLLSFSSLFLFYKIIIKLFNNVWIVGLLLIFYVSNYFIYWYPTIAMAENLVLPLFLGAIYLLLDPITKKKIILLGILSIAIYATKYANATITGSLFLIFFTKLFLIKEKKKQKLKNISLFIVSSLISFSVFALFEYFTKGNNILELLPRFYSWFFPHSVEPASGVAVAKADSWFSLNYFQKNFNIYWKALNGHSMRFLWDSTPIVSKYAGSLGLLGFVLGIFNKRFRYISLGLLLLVFSAVLFLSTFYTTDARYIYHAIPTLLIGFGVFLSLILEKLKTKNQKTIFYIMLLCLALFYILTNTIRIKNQIVLNLKYAETPWYYITVKNYNEYFDSAKISENKKPILISALAPYYVDFFSNKNFTLLPLSRNQEFPSIREIVWGPNDYSDLIKLYFKYLDGGYAIYVSNYGLGNEQPLHDDFDKIGQNFDLKKVKSGCFEACNIYKVEKKSSLTP